jgi:dimethylhistidine N-methyltransferase
MNILARTALRRAQPAEAPSAFARDVIEGLSAPQKYLHDKHFYDAAGSRLFEEITALPEYYPTRTELGILRAHAAAIVGPVRPGTTIVEFGSGATTKVRVLLAAVPQIAAYVPVDISVEFLNGEAARLKGDFPLLEVLPVAADFSGLFELPRRVRARPLVGFFPGSTIGNFEPPAAAAFLRRAAGILGPGAALVVGVDLVKDSAVLDAAYDDAAGVTARFNLNILARINRELGGDFDLEAFTHRAFFDRAHSRIEMHLVSRMDQQVRVAGHTFEFQAGETIHTENSYKYTCESFAALAADAGWTARAVFTDAKDYFSVHALTLK